MRRNLVPITSNKNSSFSNKRTIANHLNKIGTMVNAPSRRVVMNRIPEPNINIVTDSEDEDYLDDYLLNPSDSSESDSDN